MLLDARDGAGHVRLAIDHVALIHHDSRNGGDAQAPCVGNALVSEAMRRWRSAPPWLSRRFTMAVACSGSAGSCRRKLGFDPGRFVQLDQPLAAHGLDRVAAVGDDHHIGCEGGRAQHGQGRRAAQRPGQGFASPMRSWMKMLACRVPES